MNEIAKFKFQWNFSSRKVSVLGVILLVDTFSKVNFFLQV